MGLGIIPRTQRFEDKLEERGMMEMQLCWIVLGKGLQFMFEEEQPMKQKCSTKPQL